ncbi:MAG: hypothetical protein NZM12_03175 [Steroidobacteraceae bacterium]|nr:hypothetical protein [Steroidobacteraceae bacterium]MDW8258336.1 hypothetical protein [Gammaproteobacteria bacterium]
MMSYRSALLAGIVFALGVQPLAAHGPARSSAVVPRELPGMSAAIGSEKISAPVGVFYQHLAGGPAADDPTLSIAVVPQIAAESLRVELVADHGVRLAYGGAPFALRQVKPASIHRRLLRIERSGRGAAYLRVLAFVEADGARSMGIFLVPVDKAAEAASAAKQTGKPPLKRPQQ